jgi:hypothetical protein
MPFAPFEARAHCPVNCLEHGERAMMIAIERLVSAFEALLIRQPWRPAHGAGAAAANDNAEMEDEERRWASFR